MIRSRIRGRGRLVRLLLAVALATGALAGLATPAGAGRDRDLAIHTFVKPNVVTAGDQFDVTITVRNVGSTDSRANINLFLSNDRALDPSDRSLGSCSFQQVNARGRYSCSLTVSISSTGFFYLIAGVEHALPNVTDPIPMNNVRVAWIRVVSPPPS